MHVSMAITCSFHGGICLQPLSCSVAPQTPNTPETLKRELDQVRFAASEIITRVHALEPGEAQFHDPQEPSET
ncbi:MAG: hypothetical protein NVS4B12_22070 [Ktedonobacteraceae bacterium]